MHSRTVSISPLLLYRTPLKERRGAKETCFETLYLLRRAAEFNDDYIAVYRLQCYSRVRRFGEKWINLGMFKGIVKKSKGIHVPRNVFSAKSRRNFYSKKKVIGLNHTQNANLKLQSKIDRFVSRSRKDRSVTVCSGIKFILVLL